MPFSSFCFSKNIINTLVLHKETGGQANKLPLQKLRQMKLAVQNSLTTTDTFVRSVIYSAQSSKPSCVRLRQATANLKYKETITKSILNDWKLSDILLFHYIYVHNMLQVERKVQLIQLNYCLNLSGCFDLCRVACQEVKTK
ncbi:hypothetical protein T4B_8151 [Trichinella pseudospiralis]|uniref:Uncharacterized protein n=1 Tax=Trichinella pseudospiralis TaxID=6337 RepID=A0A0V1IKX5_TRIPS|nr:hypothetical protein T4B_8151 [Trichinella pseudospiralis]